MRKIFLYEALLFLLTQLLGVAVAYILFNSPGIEIEAVSVSEFPLVRFIISFVVVVGIIFLVSKFLEQEKDIFFRVVFSLIAILGGISALEAFFAEPIPILVILGLLALWFKWNWVWVHNLLLVLGIAGIGATMGLSLNPMLVVLLLAGFSVYDLISVYKTKVTQRIAKSMLESKAVLGMIIPNRFTGFSQSIKKVSFGKEKEKSKNFFIIGSGDIIFPLILAASLVYQGIVVSWIIVGFSSAGLLLSFWLFFKLGKTPMPALPPIALLSLLGYLCVILLL